MSTLNVSTIHGLTQSTPVQFAVAPTFPTRPANDSSTASATTEFVGSALNAALAAHSASNKIFYAAGEPLPQTDKGPIWHADYNSWMTWQSFTANGANYTGYASQFVGRIEMDTQPTSRPGYRLVGSETLALSRSQFAALRAWGLHNGRFVAAGVWQAGTLLMADNADGVTFRAFDVRGEFPRFWDDGRGVDAGRVFGSFQADELKSHLHTVPTSYDNGNVNSGNNLYLSGDGSSKNYMAAADAIDATGGSETRPRNTAFSAMLKF